MIRVGDMVGYRTAQRKRQRVAQVREVRTLNGQTAYRVLKRTKTHWLAEVEDLKAMHTHDFQI